MPNEIFISYARLDDRTLKENGIGLVSAACSLIEEEFGRQGDHGISIWRDIFNIEAYDLYRPMLEEALRKAELLAVFHSKNWEASKNCLWEIETFSDKFRQKGLSDDQIKARIVPFWINDKDTAGANHWLDGKTGFRLHAKEGNRLVPLYDRDVGKSQSDKWYQVVGKSGRGLLKLAVEKLQLPRKPEKVDVLQTAEQPSDENWNGLTIYVAVPASDMREPYDRVVHELTRRGYRVVPDPTQAMPASITEENLDARVRKGLEEAAFSVHLLGSNRGFIPEATQPATRHLRELSTLPLTHRQLLAAQERVPLDRDPKPSDFRRVIWAPSTQPDDLEHAIPRDPFDTLKYHLQISKQNDDTGHIRGDKVIGDVQTNFVHMLIDLADRVPREVKPEPIQHAEGEFLYLYRDEVDRDAALNIADRLKELQIPVTLPAQRGSERELLNDHRLCLRLCSEFLICWKQANDTWVRSQVFELLDWRSFGRKQPFRLRAVVALPPNGAEKDDFVAHPPAGTVDEVIDIQRLDPDGVGDLGPLLEHFERKRS